MLACCWRCVCQLACRVGTTASGCLAELLEGLGLGEGALPRLIRSAYHLLGLRTFLTTGDKESRAWTVRAGAHAPEAAGRIHSDLQRGFIRAEVIRWDELLELTDLSGQTPPRLSRLLLDLLRLQVEDIDYFGTRRVEARADSGWWLLADRDDPDPPLALAALAFSRREL